MRLTARSTLGAATLTVGLVAGACSSEPAPPAGAESTPSTAPPATPEQPAVTPSEASASPDPAAPAEQAEQAEQAELAELAELDRSLIAAAWDNDLERARRLVSQGADVNAQDGTRQSAFLIATSEGYDDLLELTLGHGADVDARDSFDGTGLIRAAERGHWSVVGRLVRAGVPLDHVNNLGWTALHEATTLGDGSERYIDTARVLVAAGVDVTVRAGRDGRTAAEMAADRGYEFAGLLGDAASVTEADRQGADQRLLAAAAEGRPDDVALALRAGARIEARDEHHRTPLLLAATYDHVDVARLLVAMGADPDALDDRHDTPWLVTGLTGSVPMLEELLPAHPDLTIRNRFGGISVIPASERGHVDYVHRVVQTGSTSTTSTTSAGPPCLKP